MRNSEGERASEQVEKETKKKKKQKQQQQQQHQPREYFEQRDQMFYTLNN